MGVANGSNVRFMVDGVVVGEGVHSISLNREEEPRELGFSRDIYEGTVTLEDAMVCDLTRGYEAFMEKRRRLHKYEEQARESLAELRKGKARQIGKGWSL